MEVVLLQGPPDRMALSDSPDSARRPPSRSATPLQARHHCAALERRVSELERELASVEEARDAAQEVRDVLETNISVLYNTAKLELQRKDREIKELRARWDGGRGTVDAMVCGMGWTARLDAVEGRGTSCAGCSVHWRG